jgi:hypothetical protein
MGDTALFFPHCHGKYAGGNLAAASFLASATICCCPIIPKTKVAARERKKRKARQMNDENEDRKNGGWRNLQIPSSLCPLRSFAAVQFRSPG